MNLELFRKLVFEALEGSFMNKGDDAHLYGFGEPTLHDQLDEMILLLSSNWISTKINTNALAIDEGLWQRLSLSGLSKCLISLDGLDEESYLRYRKGGDFNRVIQNTRYICAHPNSTEIELQFIAFQYNEEKLEDFIKFAKDIGAHVATIKKPRTWVGGTADFEGLRNLSAQHIRDKKSINCRFSEDYGLVLQNGDLTVCTADAFGRYSIGNIFEKGPSLWESEDFKRVRALAETKVLELCENCGYKDAYVKKIRLK